MAALAGVWLLLGWGGDRWWFATLILFGPRWVCALPLAVLVPLVLWKRRRMLRHLAAAALIVVGPVMGFCLPWASGTVAGRPTIRVLTCNLKGNCHDNKALNELIRTVSPDVVALQGCGGEARVDWPEGWQVCRQGELLVASAYPVPEWGFSNRRHPRPHGPRPNSLCCAVETPAGEVFFSSLHLRSPHSGIDDVLDRKTLVRPSAAAGNCKRPSTTAGRSRREAALWHEEIGPCQIIAGDFNLPPDSSIYGQHWSGYANAFSCAGWGFGYTEWPKMRKIRFGIRIDHILTSGGWRPQSCWVGPDVGSDHLPLIAELQWTGQEGPKGTVPFLWRPATKIGTVPVFPVVPNWAAHLAERNRRKTRASKTLCGVIGTTRFSIFTI